MVEPYLGDMYGEPLPPMRPLRMPRHRHPGWIERGVHLILAWIGIGALGAMVLAWLILLFMFFTVEPALATTYRIPAECQSLANRYGVKQPTTEAEANHIVAQLDANSRWPGVSQCRKAVKRDWKL